MQAIYQIHTMLDHIHDMSLHMEVRPYHSVLWNKPSRPHRLITRKYWPFMRPAARSSGWGRWPNMSNQIVGWSSAKNRPWCSRTMRLALLSSKTAISKGTGQNIFCLSFSLPTIYKRPERSKWSKYDPVKIRPINSLRHFRPARSGSSRIRLGCVGWKTSTEVHIRGSSTCCTLFPSSWFCPTGFSW